MNHQQESGSNNTPTRFRELPHRNPGPSRNCCVSGWSGDSARLGQCQTIFGLSYNLLQLLHLRCLHPPLLLLCFARADGASAVAARRSTGGVPECTPGGSRKLLRSQHLRTNLCIY